MSSKAPNLKMNLIAAACENMGIGKNNDLPWRLPKEMQYFQDMTTKTEDPSKKNVVIMGRKCWDSIPAKWRPLKGRFNVVISRTLSESPTGAILCRSLDEAYQMLTTSPLMEQIETIWNIGGRDIYELGLQSTSFDRLYLTRILAPFDCDVYFPDPKFETLRQIKLPHVPEDVQEENNIRYRFEVYERLTKID